jgi:uncharacterized repeat protein (TIGR02543 family)
MKIRMVVPKRTIHLTLIIALVSSLLSFGANPAIAVADGTVPCSGGGSFTISGTVVTGNTDCVGSAVVPEGVTALGNSFYNSALSSITLPSTLVIIGDSALRETQLVSVVIPASVTSIGFLSLASRGLTSVTFGAGSQLSTIGGYAFQSTKFSSITIPESVTSIASTAFQLNTALTSIVFNGTIPAGWPWSAPANVQVSGKVNCGTSGYFTISSNSVASNDLCRGSVTIPEGVVAIGAHAFDHDVAGPHVETLTISSTVQSIGNFAFRKSKLTELVIPNNVTSIGIQSFIFSEEITSIVIGSGITAIPDNAFDALVRLNSLTLPSTLTSIGGYAFWNTQQLTTVTIPDGVHTIAENAFGEPPVGRTINYCGNASLTGTLVTERTIRNTSSCTPAPPLSLAANAGSESATISFSAGASFGASITNYEYSINGGSYVALSPADSTSPISISGLTNGTTYSIRLKAISSRGSGAASTIVSVTPLAAALTPTFGTSTATSGGFTVQISNYSADYTWAGTATVGSVSISGTGLVTVTGVTPATSSTATITTTRTGYTGGSAPVTATSSLGTALTPTFGTPTATSSGFTVQISNYSANYTWAGTATAGGSVSISETGTVTVTGIAVETSSTATITTTRTGYTGGSAPITGSSRPNVVTPTFAAWSNVSKTYGDPSFTVTEPTVTGSVAGTFSYASATTSVISVSGTSLTVEGSGSSVITATFTPTDLESYNIATTTMIVTVAKASRTLTIDSASYGTIYKWPINNASVYYTYRTINSLTSSPALPIITATVSAGSGTLSYVMSGFNTCLQARGQAPGTVAISNRYMGGHGSCTVRATISSDANYLQTSSDMVLFYFVPARTFTVTYSPNSAGGSAERTSETYQEGRTPISLPGAGTMVKTGFTWQGWSVSGSTPVISGAYTPTGNTTLKAVWSPAAYTFSFSANGGIDTPTSISRTIGESFVLPNPITRPSSGGISYQFAGWKSGDSVYESGDTFRVGSSDLTFTAQWVRQYEVTYLANGGVFATGETEKDSQCISNICNANQVITLNLPPTRSGYTFGGWEAPGGISVSDIDADTAGIQTAVTDPNYIFSANWTPIQYTINYISSGSTAPTQSVLSAGETFTVGAAVTRTEYTFGGWNDGAATYWPDSTYVVGTSAISLTAQWIYDLNPYDGTNGRVTCSVAGNFTVSENSVTAATNCQGAVVIPSGVTNLAFDLFKDNSLITALTIPNTVLSIGSNAFTNTSALTSFTYCGSNLIEGDFTNAGLESKTRICAVSNSVNTQNSPSPPVERVPISTPNVISSADIARAKAAEKKAELEKLQIKVAQNQKTYLEPFPVLTTSEASTPSLIPDPKSGVSLNTGAVTINSSQSASVRIPARNLSLSRVVIDELKSRVRILVTTTGIAITPVNGFTGLVVVPVIGVVDGLDTLVLNKVVVNPMPPKVQSFGPTSIKQSSITWAPSTSQTIGYRVTLNGNEICQTTANTCPVAELIGPKSVVTITSMGNDQTDSIPVVIPYSATRPIPALKVNFAVGSSLLSQAQKREIQSIATVIDTQGFSRIVVSGFTDSSGSAALNRKLSQDRAKSVAAFMRTLLPKVAIKASAFGPRKPLASNGSESGKAQNRRTEIATW